MAHDTHLMDGVNKDLKSPLLTYEDFDRALGDWKDPFPDPVVREYDGITVVREDLLDVGSKARAAHALVWSTADLYDEYVYCQPRCGYAGISLAYVCQLLDKKCTLWRPEAAEVSVHQKRCIELGANMLSHKIYGMSGLRKRARDYAEEKNEAGGRVRVIQMGLKDEPLCNAAFARAARRTGLRPTEVWTVLSTGQMTRSLQIAWPDAEFHGVAVARNMHAGECGTRMKKIYSHPFPFNKDEALEHLPPFQSASNYDAKAWRFIKEYASNGAVFWNVAA